MRAEFKAFGNKVRSFEKTLGSTQRDIVTLDGRMYECKQEETETAARTTTELVKVQEAQKQLEEKQTNVMMRLQEQILKYVENKLQATETEEENGIQEARNRLNDSGWVRRAKQAPKPNHQK